jgi:hypothetical protein
MNRMRTELDLIQEELNAIESEIQVICRHHNLSAALIAALIERCEYLDQIICTLNLWHDRLAFR